MQVRVRVGEQKAVAVRFTDDIAFCTEKKDLKILLD